MIVVVATGVIVASLASKRSELVKAQLVAG
jgi:hypothetical protein